MKRFVSVCLALLLSSMGFGCIDALALPAADMSGGSFEVINGGLDNVSGDITWTAELLYSFELFMNSVGVRVTSKAVPAVALAWEAQAKVDSPAFYAELAELSQMDGVDRLDTLFGHTWAGSIRDFCLSDACTGYGTANFSFGSGVVDIVNKHLDVAFKGVYTPYSEKVTSVVDYNYCFSYSFVVNPGMAKEIIYYYDLYAPMGADVVCVYPAQISTGGDLNRGIHFAGFSNKGTSFYNDWLKVVISRDVRQAGGGYVFSHYRGPGDGLGTTHYDYAIENPDTYWNSFPYPVFRGSTYAQNYVLDGTVKGLLHSPELGSFEDLYTPEKIASAVPALQKAALVNLPTIASDFAIPETAAERESILKAVRNADTVETLVKALADARILADSVVDNPPMIDTDTDTFPSLDGITKTLTSILTSIKAIPAQITDFFNIDTAAVSGSFTGLKDALFSRFEPIVKLANAFDGMSYNLETAIPVYKMAVPASMYDIVGDTEIIVFDLRGYEQYVYYFRTFVQVAVWVTFAFVVINLFDVKFHVG